MQIKLFPLIILAVLLSACSGGSPSNPPPASTSTPDAQFISQGGGEPRTPAYWLLWNTCADTNQSEIAKANGGRATGWFLMDDLLLDPGVLVGGLPVEACQDGINLLQAQNLQGVEMQSDVAYPLAAQLLAAQLNLTVGSEYCPTSDQAVSQAQALLLKLNFDGTGSYLGPPVLNQEVEAARSLVEKLTQYNAGTLCVQQ